MCPLRIPYVDLDPKRRAVLLAVADLAVFRPDPDHSVREVASHLRSVLSFDAVDLGIFDRSRKMMKMRLWDPLPPSFQSLEVAVEDSIVGSVWRNQTITSIDNLAKEKHFGPGLRWLHERDIRSYCVVPLTNLHGKLGAIGFGSKLPRAFNDQDRQFLLYVAEFMALYVDTNLADTTVAEEVAGLRLLLEVSGSRRLDPPHHIAQILESLQKWAVQNYVGIYLYEEHSQALRLHMLNPELAGKMAPQALTPIESTLAGQAFRSRRSIFLDHTSLRRLPFASVHRGLEMGVKSLCLCPLLSKRGSMGVLKVARRDGRVFSSRDIALLERVAAIFASKLGGIEERRKPQDPSTEMGKNGVSASSGSAGFAGRWQDLLLQAAGEPGAKGTTFSARQDLMESEPLLSAYFKASRVGLCILDADFRYLAVNDTLAEMNGARAAKHIGKSVGEILGDFAELVVPQFRRVFATGEPITDFEISFVLPNRSEPGHWIEHYIPIKNMEGEVAQIGVIAVEVTEQKKLEESLRSVSETLRQEKKRQHVLVELSRLLATKWDIRQAFPQVSAYLRRVLGQEYAALSLREEGSGMLVPHAVDFPLGKKPTAGAEIGAARGPGGKALEQQSALIFGREEMQAFDSVIAARLTSEGLKSLCCVPLLRPTGPLGVLVLGSTRADAFHPEDLTLLTQVAAQLAIALENATIAREIEQLKQRFKREKNYMEGEPRARVSFEENIGKSPALQQVLDQVAIVAPSDATVLIQGETGTGKGLIARAIHRVSQRKDRSFVTLNCAAIPTGLLESELFGHERGAFTGAVSQKIGRLELANHGTLFLDEIGEIPLEVQPKLLRVLQDHEFERLGGTRTIKVNLRLIAATNRDLARSVAAKEFRSDLFYRLNVFPIQLPSLRARREDIPLLVRHFVRKFSLATGRDIQSVPSETMEALIHWHWPGNIRELENFIERSVILTDGNVLRAPLAEFQAETSSSKEKSLEETEREHIVRALRETGGQISGPAGAARRLGLKRTTLQSKMERLGITRDEYSGHTPG
jgi:formate hydrogenlyase transcriptional activator